MPRMNCRTAADLICDVVRELKKANAQYRDFGDYTRQKQYFTLF